MVMSFLVREMSRKIRIRGPLSNEKSIAEIEEVLALLKSDPLVHLVYVHIDHPNYIEPIVLTSKKD
jgi:phosphoribosyl 1,2-cyclic phosphodiesterase